MPASNNFRPLITVSRITRYNQVDDGPDSQSVYAERRLPAARTRGPRPGARTVPWGTQKSVPITLVAAGLPQIPRLTGEAGSYAERLFSFPVIATLTASDAMTALMGPARQQGVEYEPEALDLALAWTGGYPFYIQQVGKHAWNIASRSPITVADVEAAMPAAQLALDASIYEVRIQRATDHERRYMRAMAELGSGPYRSGDVAAKLGRKTSEVSMLRQRIIDKGLVYGTVKST